MYRAQKTWEMVPEHVKKCKFLMEIKIKIKTSINVLAEFVKPILLEWDL